MNHTAVKEIVYDSFGNITEDSNESFKIPLGFAGGLQDRETGLVHFGYREYDPFIGRWTSKDPIGFNGGDSNLYGYVLNDPVNLVDPEGTVWQYILGAIGAYLAYDTITDWYKYLKKSKNNIDQNKEIRTIDDYKKYKKYVKNQLDNSCEIGKETTLDLLKGGYPISKPVDTATGAIYEISK